MTRPLRVRRRHLPDPDEAVLPEPVGRARVPDPVPDRLAPVPHLQVPVRTVAPDQQRPDTTTRHGGLTMPSIDLINERHRDEWAEWLTARGYDPANYLDVPVEIRHDVVILQRVATGEGGQVIYHDDGHPRTMPYPIPYADRDDLPPHQRTLRTCPTCHRPLED